MDRSIAIEKAKLVLEEVTETEDAVCYVTSEDIEWLEMAISSLETLDKIDKIVSISPDEFKQCGLRELKEILEVLAYGT